MRWVLCIFISLLIFALGFFLGKKRESSPPETSQPLSTLPALSGQSYSFAEVLKSTDCPPPITLDLKNPNHAAICQIIITSGNTARTFLESPESPLRSLARINEASRFFEEQLRELIDADPDFSCTIPQTREGREQRAGYPDLQIIHLPSQTIAYLDPKLYHEKSLRSSLRTFYFEPTEENSKVTQSALHLLIGFAHDGKSQRWAFPKQQLIDLSELEVTLKTEFSASNKDLYPEKP